MNIAIIEDNAKDRALLLGYFESYFKQFPIYKTIQVFDSGNSFMKCWEKGAFDLIFIDIVLGDTNGMEIAEQVREQDSDCLIIFSSVSSEYGVQSYRVRAFDYLLKPYTYEQFKASLDLCRREFQKHGKYIEVKESRTYIKILLDDIIFTDYFNHYIQIHTRQRVVKSYLRFEAFAPMLLAYPQFLCCYRNCIVNMDKIAYMEKYDFIMETKEHVPITRAERQAIHQQYADYQFNKMSGGV